MGNKEDEEFYRKIQILSRKELQGLCRIYGLPSDTSVDDLVKSMLSSLERTSTSSITSGEKSSGNKELRLSASVTLQLQRGTQLKSRAEVGKVGCGIVTSHTRKEANSDKCSTAECKETGIIMLAETCAKASVKGISEGFRSSSNTLQETSHSQIATLHDESGFNSGAGDLPPVEHRDINIGLSSGESAPASSTKASSSLFEYHVRSDEGINLYVDLNSDSSYWTHRLKNEVYISPHGSGQSFQDMHQDIGQRFVGSAREDKSLSLWNKLSGCGANDGNIKTVSFPSSNLREKSLMEDTPDVDGGSCRSCAVQACTVGTSGCFPEDQVVSRPCFDVENHMISGAKICFEDGETTLNSSICSFSKVKTVSNSSANSTSDGPKSLDAWKNQNSKLGSGICENATLQNTSNVVNPIVASGFVEMRLCEDVNHSTSASFSPCGNSEVLDLVNGMHNVETENVGFAVSTVHNRETCIKPLGSGTGEQEGGTNLDKGTKSIETLHVGNSFDKTCLKSDTSDSAEGLHRKRKNNDGEFHCSTEHPPGEILPRRSTRLVSKVATFIGKILNTETINLQDSS